VTDDLAKREQLMLSIQIVDSRHDPSKLDLQLREWLTAYAKPHLTVATKSDKLSQNELRKNIGRAREILGAATAAGEGEVVAYSAVTGYGRERVWRAIEEAITVSHSPS
jgi:GTP-binding protein